jgi:hypothetical protein
MSGASRPTVDKWLKRYEQFGMDGLVSRTSPEGRGRFPHEGCACSCRRMVAGSVG